MTTTLDKAALQAIAGKVFHYMTVAHSGATDPLVGVDANLVSWGLDINQLSRYPTLYGQGLTLMLLGEYTRA